MHIPLNFQFRTMMQNFFFFIVGHVPTWFMMMEVIDSNVFHLIHHDGLYSQTVKIQLLSPINDNSWHQFSLEIFNDTELLLRTDGFSHFHYFQKKIKIDNFAKIFLGRFPRVEQWEVVRKVDKIIFRFDFYFN